MGFKERLLGQYPDERPEYADPAPPPTAASGMTGVAAAAAPISDEEIVVRAPSPAFQAAPDRIGAAVQGDYARFNEPEVVPWPGVYSLLEDGSGPEYYLEFDAQNAVYVYAELKNAR